MSSQQESYINTLKEKGVQIANAYYALGYASTTGNANVVIACNDLYVQSIIRFETYAKAVEDFVGQQFGINFEASDQFSLVNRTTGAVVAVLDCANKQNSVEWSWSTVNDYVTSGRPCTSLRGGAKR